MAKTEKQREIARRGEATSQLATDTKWEDVLDLVRRGNYVETACLAVGIRPNTFYQWMERGRKAISEGDSKSIYAQFLGELKEAEAQAETVAMAVIQGAAFGGYLLSESTVEKRDGTIVSTKTWSKPEWTAAAWYLERKYPDRFGRRDRLDMRVRQEAEKMANKLGVDVDEFLEEAQRIHEERMKL